MNFFTFSSILIVITCSINSALLFKKSKENKAILVWGFVTALATIWGIGAIIFSTTKNYNIALRGWQIGGIASILAPLVHHHFVLAYLNKTRKRTLSLLYTYGFIAVIYELLYPQYFFGELKFIFNQFYFVSFFQLNNIPYLIHYILGHNILLLYSFALLIKAYKNSKGSDQNKYKYMILGSGIGWLGTHGDFLTVIIHNFYPHLNILLAIFPLIITYAIIRHQLLDIKIIIKKSIVYTILISILTILYFALAHLTEKLFQNIFEYKSFILSLCLAIFIALIFMPLKNFVQTMIDHFFFKGTPIEIAEENKRLRDEAAQKEKFKAVATLASSLAHDIRNPITTLKTFIDHLPAKANDPQFIEKFKNISEKEFARIENLLNNLLDYSKPSTPQLAETDIHAVIDESLDLLSNDAIKHTIKIEKSFNADPHVISADNNQLKQVFLNLFLNAIEAMPSGGILSIKTTIKTNQIIILITDTGYGIDKDDLKHIFDPFFTKKDAGTGLGLAIVKGIIENHRGKITVESTAGQGTTFIIRISL